MHFTLDIWQLEQSKCFLRQSVFLHWLLLSFPSFSGSLFCHLQNDHYEYSMNLEFMIMNKLEPATACNSTQTRTHTHTKKDWTTRWKYKDSLIQICCWTCWQWMLYFDVVDCSRWSFPIGRRLIRMENVKTLLGIEFRLIINYSNLSVAIMILSLFFYFSPTMGW